MTRVVCLLTVSCLALLLWPGLAAPAPGAPPAEVRVTEQETLREKQEEARREAELEARREAELEARREAEREAAREAELEAQNEAELEAGAEMVKALRERVLKR